MGYIGETCGAVTGALMLIGLNYGKVHVEDNGAKDKTYDLVLNDLVQVEAQVRELMLEADIAYFSSSFGVYESDLSSDISAPGKEIFLALRGS